MFRAEALALIKDGIQFDAGRAETQPIFSRRGSAPTKIVLPEQPLSGQSIMRKISAGGKFKNSEYDRGSVILHNLVPFFTRLVSFSTHFVPCSNSVDNFHFSDSKCYKWPNRLARAS